MRAISDDLPAFGRPTRPASASSLSWSSTVPSSPGSPRSASRGACRVGPAKRLLPRPPRPPLAMRTSWPGTTRSKRAPSQRSTCVPGGTPTTERLAVGAVAQRALAVPAAAGAEVRRALEELEVAQVVVAAQDHVAAAAAVAAVRAALGHVRLAAERHASRCPPRHRAPRSGPCPPACRRTRYPRSSPMADDPVFLITGASSGIGAADRPPRRRGRLPPRAGRALAGQAAGARATSVGDGSPSAAT